jgi:hypothetical protein
MFYQLISIKSIARLISIIGILAVLVSTAQVSIDLYDNQVIESAQLSVAQPDKDSNRDLGDTIVNFSSDTNLHHGAHILLQQDDANYQEPTPLSHQRPPRLSHLLA